MPKYLNSFLTTIIFTNQRCHKYKSILIFSFLVLDCTGLVIGIKKSIFSFGIKVNFYPATEIWKSFICKRGVRKKNSNSSISPYILFFHIIHKCAIGYCISSRSRIISCKVPVPLVFRTCFMKISNRLVNHLNRNLNFRWGK